MREVAVESRSGQKGREGRGREALQVQWRPLRHDSEFARLVDAEYIPAEDSMKYNGTVMASPPCVDVLPVP